MFKNFTETTAETFDTDIRHDSLPVVVDFGLRGVPHARCSRP